MAPAEAPDTFFKYKSGAYLHINSTGDNYNPLKKREKKKHKLGANDYLLS
jgi:hypothetical protein